MPRFIPLSTLPPQLRPHVRPLVANPLVNPLRQSPTPSDHLLAKASELPPNLRVQDWVDGRGRWQGISQRERLGGKKGPNFGVEREGRRWGGLKWALRER
ncbi:hypothetical protein CI109_102776 [Kwoniella shandongensis]|uniref:Uncharacterized protein n=1 Tax=Kwoniella shandongensis TaxID=1734106 RepID=A0A5M6BX17_9TREE|nr:uncharacterized protein CI109_004903 [Kwoniella shandongensis]KAA5526700.1 hypothetical protein CI109_004903 [Kwoniella shandongensis]